MKFTGKPIRRFSHPTSFATATSTATKPQSQAASNYCSISRTRTRYLLKCTTTQLWLADHNIIDDKSEVYTIHSHEALSFASIEAAVERAKLLLPLFPDLMIDAVQVPVRHG